MVNRPIAAAFGEAAERFVRHFGNGPYDGLRRIGEMDGEGFAMEANVTKDEVEIDGLPHAHIRINRDGVPVGVIGPFGGLLVACEGGMEAMFIEWCKEDTRPQYGMSVNIDHVIAIKDVS